MSGISAPLRKLLAVTILVFVAYVAWMGAVRPIIDNFERYEQDIERDRAFLGRYLGYAAIQPALETELAQLRKLEASQGGYLTGETPALAAATLQDRLKRIITRSGGILKSVQVMPPENSGHTRRIAIDVLITTDIRRLKDILYDVETVAPHLFIDEFDIRRIATNAFPASARTRGNEDRTPADDSLQVRFKVAGFMRGANP